MIQAKNIVKTYGFGRTAVEVLKDLDLKIEDGEFVTIVGPSGAGKSTLLYQLSLLDEPTSGEVYFDEVRTSDLEEREKTMLRLHKMGFVFQDYALLPELNALENVALPILMQGTNKSQALAAAHVALERLGLTDRRYNLPNQLSGGEQQRVSIARAVAHDPRVLFADEPTANLDSVNGKLVMETFLALHKEGQTIVMVTHEDEYAKYAHRTISLRDGSIVGDERRR